MLNLPTPFSTTIPVPEHADEDRPTFASGCLDEAQKFYAREGYVVLRGLVPQPACDRVRAEFERLRHTPVPILRQQTMCYELNLFTESGFLANPIFNVQDLETRRCGAFKHAVLDILTMPAVVQAASRLLEVERSKIVQSMFFEAPAGTWAHQDSYYQDSASALGRCVAGWFALEDIDATAGRFYVCPGSHRELLLRNEGAHNFGNGHERYKQCMAEIVRCAGLPVVAPYLANGDVLFWNSLTVHGSLTGGRPERSRTSLTAHYLPEQDQMMQFHTRIRTQKTRVWNGVTVGLLHDQDRWRNRLQREAAYRFPGAYMTARRLALQGLLRRRASDANVPRS